MANPSPAQIRARKKFAAMSRARAKTARAGKRNGKTPAALITREINKLARGWKHESKSRIVDGEWTETGYQDLPESLQEKITWAKFHDRVQTAVAPVKKTKRNTTNIAAMSRARAKTARAGKQNPRKNAEHRDAAHPIHVTDYWQGRRGYKTAWQRAHEAGQGQLFGVKNPGIWTGWNIVNPILLGSLDDAGIKETEYKALEAAVDKGWPMITSATNKAQHEARAKAVRIAKKLLAKYHKANPKRRNVAGMGQLTPEQAASIRLFATAHGRTWKSKLRELWMSGNYSREDFSGANSAHLQQIRNTLGPRWLINVKLSPETGRRNGPGTNLAKQRRAEFVGRPSKKILDGYAPTGSGAKKGQTLTAMGKLKKVFIKGRTPLDFKGAATLAHDPKTDQIYILGKGYSLAHLKKRNPSGVEDLGEVTRLEYEATKTHLGDLAPVTYFHKLGEEGGARPHALVNSEGLLILDGGDYFIRPEGIRN